MATQFARIRHPGDADDISEHAHHDTPDPADPTSFWEQRYAGTSGIWSGRPNRALVDKASALTPGRALDLGCGEGGDALWLAARGWTVTGLDLSATALRRADDAARQGGWSTGFAGRSPTSPTRRAGRTTGRTTW
jgi:2-polyprenyl-3-methyl-5-hydroxy-6-metoxy-1,4-benzoquinol methylase